MNETTITYTEASHPRILEQARVQVFLADVQDALRNREHVHALTLELEVVPSKFGGPSWYVIARNRDGEEVTSRDGDSRGQHGHYIHPWNGTGEPKKVAASLKNSLYWFNKRKEEKR